MISVILQTDGLLLELYVFVIIIIIVIINIIIIIIIIFIIIIHFLFYFFYVSLKSILPRYLHADDTDNISIIMWCYDDVSSGYEILSTLVEGNL